MSPVQNLADIIRKFREELRTHYPDNEIRNMGYLFAEHLLNYSKIDFHLKDQEPISADIIEKFEHALTRLKNWEPVQYITGTTEFYGLPFTVDHRVLIPRPETEELADWIIRENRSMGGIVLDIGTGSGCLAVSLAANLPSAGVWGIDVSEGALSVAKENAALNKVKVTFFKMDILGADCALQQKVQVMVSNPPYVRGSEKQLMRRNVLDYEPETALFVPDHDPLLYYRNIVLMGRKFLADGGKIYFEINEAFPDEVAKLLQSSGFYGIEVRKDLAGKPRMVRAMK